MALPHSIYQHVPQLFAQLSSKGHVKLKDKAGARTISDAVVPGASSLFFLPKWGDHLKTWVLPQSVGISSEFSNFSTHPATPKAYWETLGLSLQSSSVPTAISFLLCRKTSSKSEHTWWWWLRKEMGRCGGAEGR